ncbi:MAG TPA: hypothetical protein DEP46_02005 [Blastocatellia bacterium]|nr:hypothetical protein [Blastocatellia bacterium]
MKSFPCRMLLTPGIFALVFAFVLPAIGQYKEWRPVSPEDVASAKPVVDADADAEALFWEMRIDDSSSDDLDMWHYVRVKIFTERGREKYSKFDIPYAKGTKIRNLAARVIKADGSIVEIPEKEIFDREIIRTSGVKVKAKSFAVPNIEPGVIVEYKYKEAVDEAGASGMRLPLQRDIPVRDLVYFYKPYGTKDEPQYQAYNIKDFRFSKDQKGFWMAKRTNVPAFKEEPQMPPEDTVRPWLLLTSTRVQITNISFGGGISFVIKDPSNVRGYWGAFAGEKAGIVRFFTKKDKKITAAAEQITAGATTQTEKLRKLYDFCQTEIKNLYYDPNISEEQRLKMKPVKEIGDVLERKEASRPLYVDYLFGALANALGMEVRIAYAGNKANMFFNPNMTNERLLHLAAIAVREGDTFTYHNPGDPFTPFGTIPWHDEGSYALLVSAENFLWHNTPSLKHSENLYRRSGKFKLLEDGTLEGEVSVELHGQPALTFRQSYWDETEDKRTEAVTNGVTSRMSSAEVTLVSVENMREVSKPVLQRYKVRVPNYAQKTGRRLFITPGFFEHGIPPVFSASSRQYEIFFPYPWSENDSIEIQLPAGYSLDNADAPQPFSDPGKISSLAINVRYNTGTRTLLYERKFHFGANDGLSFEVKNYDPLKNIFDIYHKMDSHSISLKQD